MMKKLHYNLVELRKTRFPKSHSKQALGLGFGPRPGGMSQNSSWVPTPTAGPVRTQ